MCKKILGKILSLKSYFTVYYGIDYLYEKRNYFIATFLYKSSIDEKLFLKFICSDWPVLVEENVLLMLFTWLFAKHV